MGYHVVWRAVQGMELDDFLGHLMFVRTEEVEEGWPEAPRACARIGDWNIACYSVRDAWPDGDPTSLIAARVDVAQTCLDETTGFAEVSMWRGAKLKVYACFEGAEDNAALEVRGEDVSRWPAGRRLLELGGVSDPEDDVFGAIADLAAEVVGFRYDGGAQATWTVCRPDPTPISSRQRRL